jgi:hypothetical protein
MNLVGTRVSREILDFNMLSYAVETGSIAQETIIGQLKAPIKSVEKIERFRSELQLLAVPRKESATNSHVLEFRGIQTWLPRQLAGANARS